MLTFSPSTFTTKPHESFVRAKIPKCLVAAMLVTVPGVPYRGVLEINKVARGVPLPVGVRALTNCRGGKSGVMAEWTFEWNQTYWTFKHDEAKQSLELEHEGSTLVFGNWKNLADTTLKVKLLDGLRCIGTTSTDEPSPWMDKLPPAVQACITNEQALAKKKPLEGANCPPMVWKGKTPNKMKKAVRSITIRKGEKGISYSRGKFGWLLAASIHPYMWH